MLAAALEAEVAAYIAAHADQVGEDGRRLVVRNGHAKPRRVLTSAGAVEVAAPRVNDTRVDEAGERKRFASAILPPWCRKSPQITEVLPLLYLHGLSSQDFVPALQQFLDTSSGLSAATIIRLTTQWQDEARAFADRDLSAVDYVYVWADGVHLNVRLEQEKLCLLVMVGVRVDGRKELVALAEGYRESSGSWADLLRDCARRGMRAPILAVGDGALGFWTALREVFPTTREQRCWFHRSCIEISGGDAQYPSLVLYGDRCGDPAAGHHTFRGSGAASERAAKASGARGRGPAPRPRRGASGRPGGRSERDDRTDRRVRTGTRRRSPAGRPRPPARRRPQATDRA